MVSKSQFWPIASLRLVCVWICVFVSYFLLPVIWRGSLWFLTIDFDFQSSSAPEFSFCVCPVFVIPRYIAAITITPTTNTNTHKTIVYFDTSKSWWWENTFQLLRACEGVWIALSFRVSEKQYVCLNCCLVLLWMPLQLCWAASEREHTYWLIWTITSDRVHCQRIGNGSPGWVRSRAGLKSKYDKAPPQHLRKEKSGQVALH